MELVTVCDVLAILFALAGISGLWISFFAKIQYQLFAGTLLLFLTTVVLRGEKAEQKRAQEKPEPRQVVAP